MSTDAQLKSRPSATRVRDLLSYDAETGIFSWRPRPVSEFSSARQFKTWNKRYAGKKAGKQSSGGYLQIRFDGQAHAAHRMAWLVTYGDWPVNDIDHINGIRLDNRIANLRDVTRSENMKNVAIAKHNTSGVMGVSWMAHIERWQAYIRVDGRRINLGYYKAIDEAASARKAAEVRYGFHPNHGRKGQMPAMTAEAAMREVSDV
ncbi:HNH endonuclease [compost metagenome]